MRIGVFFTALFFIQIVSFSQTESFEYYISANALFKQNKFDQAIELLNKNIDIGNEDQKTRFLLGNCYFQEAEYEMAIQQFQIAYKLKNEFSTYKIAECYALQNQDFKAIEYLKVYLKIKDKLLMSEIKSNPNFKSIENSKVWITLWKEELYNSYENQLDEAKFSISKGNYADAFYILDRLIIKDKNRYRALAMRAELYLLTENYKLASQDFLKAFEKNKRNIDYKIKAADSFFKDKKFNKARLLYTEILIDHPYHIDILKNKVSSEIELNNIDQAESDIKEYLRYNVEDSEALNLYGLVFSKKGDYISALEQFNTCIKNNSNEYLYFIHRADAYLQTGMNENAVYDYSMAIDLNPEVPEIYYKKGIANLKINIKEACSDFIKARSMNYHKADDYLIKYCE